LSLSIDDAISVRDMTVEDIGLILDRAERHLSQLKAGAVQDTMHGRVMACLFFEPSTRTRFSFEAAWLRLGGSHWGFSSTSGTSVEKGESLSDTIRMADRYADLLVMRHPLEGSARLAAQIASHPVINGGDGGNQHPTQTLLDLFTIRKLKGRIEGTVVALAGDLKHARTMRSLLYALVKLGARPILVAPPTLEMSEDVLWEVHQEFGVQPPALSRLEELVSEPCEVLYSCRIQKERFSDPLEASRIAGAYTITPNLLYRMDPSLIVMHPLPRTEELPPEVDQMKQARYFEQAGYGIPVRMALMELLIEGQRRA